MRDGSINHIILQLWEEILFKMFHKQRVFIWQPWEKISYFSKVAYVVFSIEMQKYCSLTSFSGHNQPNWTD